MLDAEAVILNNNTPLDDSEHSRLVKDLSTSGPVNPVESKLHQLVKSQAKQTPTAVSVEFGDQYLVYAQFNAKANRLTRLLG